MPFIVAETFQGNGPKKTKLRSAFRILGSPAEAASVDTIPLSALREMRVLREFSRARIFQPGAEAASRSIDQTKERVSGNCLIMGNE